MWIYLYTLFIHLSVNEHVGCFHLLAVLNSAAIDVCVCVCVSIVFLGDPAFYSYGHLPRSDIARSYDNSI